MRKLSILLILVIVAACLPLAEEARLMRFPDIHGDQVVFVYAGDLWLVSTGGGTARRLTTHPGQEQFPKFSPDGRHIAFSAVYDGNTDVFVIPTTGGEPKRLTFHPGNDTVLDWYPDGEHILFRSLRESHSYRFNRFFKVAVSGSTPEALPLPEGELASFSPDAGRLVYNRWSREFRTWKRYRGGRAPEVWIYNFKDNSIENITNNDANDQWPLWVGNKIYFASDRDELMKYNLYEYDLGTRKTTRLTDFKEYDLQWPSAGPEAIVFENGGRLYTQPLNGGKAAPLRVEIYSDNIYTRPAVKNVQGYIHNMGISPTGKRALFEARGEIFTVPAEKGEIRNLTRTPGVRERAPAWSPDGKWVAYASDKTGEFQIYIREGNGQGEEIQLTSDLKTYLSNLSWSPDSKKILYSDVTNTLWYLDIEEKKPAKVFHNDYAAGGNFVNGVWSPDSNWIAYAKADPNMMSSVYLFSLEQNQSHRITNTLYSDASPAFDPEGKYLYWIAAREFNFRLDPFEWNYSHVNTSKVVMATLAADTANPLGPESDEEEVKAEKKEEKTEKAEGEEKAAAPAGEDQKPAEDKKEAEAKTGDKPEEKKKEGPEPIKIDLDGLGARLIDLPIPDGNYAGLSPVKDGVLFLSFNPGNPGATLSMFNLKQRKTETIFSGMMGGAVSFDGKKALYRQGAAYGIIDIKPNQKPGTGKLDLGGLQTLVNYRAEWKQVFNEAWRQARDFFYDQNYHGQDWDKVHDRYAHLLPYAVHRDDINYLIGETIAELGCSHTYRRGGEYPRFARTNVGLLACDLVAEGDYYRISTIYEGENWNPQRRGPLSQPGLKVKEGDYLLAIEGQAVKAGQNPLQYLVGTADRTITLKINDKPSTEDAWEIQVKPVADDQLHRYIHWVMANIEKVNKATDGRVGYIHLPDTAEGGMEWFNRLFYSQVDKDGLIVDVRWNSGGFPPDIYVERLLRKTRSFMYNPYSKNIKWPYSSQDGPKVCLINAYAGSGGDAFPFHFKQFGIGPLIGMRTWGGLVGISGNPVLMDNGGVDIADVAFIDPDTGLIVAENHGIEPDIPMDNLPPEVIKGHDPQLERGIQEVLDRLKTYKSPTPKPGVPKRITD